MSKKKEKETAVIKEEKEEVTPEVVVTDAKPANIYNLKKTLEAPLGNTIENERKALFKYYKNLTTRNNIIMFVAVAIFVAAFILLAQGTWGMITGWCMVGVTVVGMVIYHILTRNNYPRMSKKYFNLFWTSTNDYIFQSDKFSDCSIDFNEKYQLADMSADRVYKDIIDIASRNLVHGKYNGKDFTFGELAFYKPGQRKHSREVIFVGRHITFSNNLAIPEGRFVVNIRGDKELDLPNDVEDLVELTHEGNFVIYGLEGSNPEKAIGKDVLFRLRNFTVADSLVNVNIVFWSGRTSVYLSYDDAIVAIPFTEAFKFETYQQLKNNVDEMFDILAEL